MNMEYLQPQVRVVNGVLGFRYRGDYADHAVVLNPTAKSDRDAAHRFCAQHASRGAEMWVLDGMPGSVAAVRHVALERGLPVFVMGSRATAANLQRALDEFNLVWGAILVTDESDSNGRADISVGHPSVPILSVVTERDRSPSGAADHTEEVRLSGEGQRRPLLAHPSISDIISEWCLRQLSNHLNPRWDTK